MAPVLAVILNAPAAGASAGKGLPVAFLLVFGVAAGFHLNTAKGLKSFLESPAAFSSMADRYASWLRQPVELAAVAGLFSCLHAVLNTTVRVVYAMAWEGVHAGCRGSVLRSAPRTSPSTHWWRSR